MSSIGLVNSKHGTRAKVFLALSVLDMFMICCGFLLASILYLGNTIHDSLTIFLPLFIPAYFIIGIRNQAFRVRTIIDLSSSIKRSLISLLISLVLIISVVFFAKVSDELSRGVAITGGILSAILLSIERYVFARYAFTVLDGSPESEVVLIDGLDPPEGCTAFKVDLRQQGIEPDINNPVMLDRIGLIIYEADRVIVSCQPERRAAWSLALKGAGVNVEVLAPELDAIGAIGPSYHGTATALIASGPLNAVDRMIKRAFDLALAVPALLVLSPLLLGVAVAIRAESAGPILFAQKRVGRANRLFTMYKFRSMYTNRSDHNASQLTKRDDSRVTRTGRFIRKTSLDELPQLLNVIRGDMSIVGPRPHATGALAGDVLYWEVSTHYWSRHAVKPGLTGLAQVQGFRGNTETGDDLMNRLQADLAYLEAWSLWRDISLIFRTFGVLIHRNAF